MVLEKCGVFGLFYFKENKSSPKKNSRSGVYINNTLKRKIFSDNQIKENNSIFSRINSQIIKITYNRIYFIYIAKKSLIIYKS